MVITFPSRVFAALAHLDSVRSGEILAPPAFPSAAFASAAFEPAALAQHGAATLLSIPVWSLLGFAAWTLLVLVFTVGAYRWIEFFRGRTPKHGFSATQVEGADWYKRSMRAHANCLENLPVFAAIVIVIVAGDMHGAWLDRLSMMLLGARMMQTLVHVLFRQRMKVVLVRFTFFFVQLCCMVAMIGWIMRHALG